MAQEVFEGDKRHNFTATATVGKTGGSLLGVLVASSSGATIKVADSKGTICNTMTAVAGQFYPMPCKWFGELTITVSGTLDATAFFKL